jgi:hypothetical protein
MLLVERSTTALRPEDVSGEAVTLARDVAESGLDEARVERGVRVADRAVALALGLREELPREAVDVLEAVRRLENALHQESADSEAAVLDALDGLHTGLLAVQENDPVSDSRPLRDVVNWMIETLGVSQEQFATACGIPSRTLQRWLTGATPTPRAMEDRLRLILRGLNDVRFAVRGWLALAWLNQPLPAAGHRPPLELVDQPEAFQRAVMATRF